MSSVLNLRKFGEGEIGVTRAESQKEGKNPPERCFQESDSLCGPQAYRVALLPRVRQSYYAFSVLLQRSPNSRENTVLPAQHNPSLVVVPISQVWGTLEEVRAVAARCRSSRRAGIPRHDPGDSDGRRAPGQRKRPYCRLGRQRLVVAPRRVVQHEVHRPRMDRHEVHQKEKPRCREAADNIHRRKREPVNAAHGRRQRAVLGEQRAQLLD